MCPQLLTGDMWSLADDEIIKIGDQTIGGDGRRHILRVKVAGSKETNGGLIIQCGKNYFIDGIFDPNYINEITSKVTTGKEQ